MRTLFADAIIFSAGYFIVFVSLIQTFSDGGQTTGMAIIAGLFIAFSITLYYLVLSIIIQAFDKFLPAFAKAILLFVLAEVAVLTIGDGLPFFGLFHFLSNEASAFDQKRDFAFSMSGFAASVVFLAARRLREKKVR